MQRRPLSAIIHNRIFQIVDLIGEIWFLVNLLETISYSMFCLLHGHMCYQSSYGHKKIYRIFHTYLHICLNCKLVKFSAATYLLICYCQGLGIFRVGSGSNPTQKPTRHCWPAITLTQKPKHSVRVRSQVGI